MTRIALVTGGNRGIGFEVCRQLGKLGVRVLLTGRDPTEGERAAITLQEEGLEVQYHPLDVTDHERIADLAEAVERIFGRLDILVNNAGVALDQGVSVLDLPLEDLRATLEVNLYGPLALIRAFAPLMQRGGYGRIVNVSSGLGSLANMGGRGAAYKISKAALNALTRVAAAELKGAKIKVNAASPGWVRTRMGGSGATRSPEQGADTIVWLATLPEDGPTGGFFYDREPMAW